jgi:DNA modification methylase
MTREIEVFNLGGLPTAPVDDFLELQEDFKISDSDKLSKLQMLIITRGFKYAFKAWRDPDGKLWIIDAHQRKKALLSLRNSGFTIPDIPYEPIYAASKKEAVEEIAAYNSEFATKNPDTLLFQKYKIDTLTLDRFNLGFSAKPVDFNFSDKNFFEPQFSEVLDDEGEGFVLPQESCFVQPGDIWMLGQNRLMCGDSRSHADVLKLMNGRRADLCITDPPYNVAYEGGTDDSLTIDNDSMEDQTFYTFLRQCFDVMISVMRPGAPIYVFHADSEGENFRRAFREAGFKLAQCCVWSKNSLVMGRQDYQWKHEPVLYGWKPGAAHSWYSDRKQTSVWNFDKPQRSSIHPTMKPIPLIAYPVRNSSSPGSIVVDLFSGSGTTIMTCQQIDRLCYAMEIDPCYVEATIKRFMQMFIRQPVALIRQGVEYTPDQTKELTK